MNHSDCKYYYRTECEKTAIVYESLLKKEIEKTITEVKPCCGIDPVAVILDKEQLVCQLFQTQIVYGGQYE